MAQEFVVSLMYEHPLRQRVMSLSKLEISRPAEPGPVLNNHRAVYRGMLCLHAHDNDGENKDLFILTVVYLLWISPCATCWGRVAHRLPSPQPHFPSKSAMISFNPPSRRP